MGTISLLIIPVTGSLIIDNPSSAERGYTNSSLVNIQFTTSDNFYVSGYLINLDNASPPLSSEFIDTGVKSRFNYVQPYEMGSGEGMRTLYGWVLDSTGNIGGPFTDRITLDTQPPMLSIANSPNEFTKANMLSVSFNVDNASEVRLSGIVEVVTSRI